MMHVLRGEPLACNTYMPVLCRIRLVETALRSCQRLPSSPMLMQTSAVLTSTSDCILRFQMLSVPA